MILNAEAQATMRLAALHFIDTAEAILESAKAATRGVDEGDQEAREAAIEKMAYALGMADAFKIMAQAIVDTLKSQTNSAIIPMDFTPIQ